MLIRDERTEKQDVIINVILFTDTRKAGQTDVLGDSVDYKMVKKAILSLVEKSEFLLIEKLADEIAKVLSWTIRKYKKSMSRLINPVC